MLMLRRTSSIPLAVALQLGAARSAFAQEPPAPLPPPEPPAPEAPAPDRAPKAPPPPSPADESNAAARTPSTPSPAAPHGLGLVSADGADALYVHWLVQGDYNTFLGDKPPGTDARGSFALGFAGLMLDATLHRSFHSAMLVDFADGGSRSSSASSKRASIPRSSFAWASFRLRSARRG